MRRIDDYVMEHNNHKFRMFKSSRVLSAFINPENKNQIIVSVISDTKDTEEVTREFYAYGTGFMIHHKHMEFISTVHFENDLVFHIFEVVNES